MTRKLATFLDLSSLNFGDIKLFHYPHTTVDGNVFGQGFKCNRADLKWYPVWSVFINCCSIKAILLFKKYIFQYILLYIFGKH